MNPALRPVLPRHCAAPLFIAALLLPGCATPPPKPAAGAPAPAAVLDLRAESDALRVSTLDAQRVDRITFGVDAAMLQSVGQLGYSRWLDAQLHPGPQAFPAALEARLQQLSPPPLLDRLRADQAQKKAADDITDDAQKQSAQQAFQKTLNGQADDAAQRWLLHALNSPWQVRERMAWFWINHFSIAQSKADLRAFVGDYEATMRAHALGKFRDLLAAATFHPAMLRYLDNERNGIGQVNENFARELMELHTLGVDGGYAQGDVQEMARVLTGVGVRVDDKTPALRPQLQARYVRSGAFEFNPARHDGGDKVVLGQPVHGGGLDEVRAMIDRLARSPATAHHLSFQLAQYFVADTPPPALVDRLAQRYLATDGDIAAVLKTLFTAPEFDDSLGRRFKDPWEFVLSASRLAYDGDVILNAAPALNALNRLGETPFGHQTPEGYPITESAWDSPGQMTARFEIAKNLVGGNGGGNANFFRIDTSSPPPAPLPGQAPPKARVESAAWLRTQGPRLSDATRQALADTLRAHPGDWAWAAIASPEFMRN